VQRTANTISGKLRANLQGNSNIRKEERKRVTGRG
jgi:hypothetical protein